MGAAGKILISIGKGIKKANRNQDRGTTKVGKAIAGFGIFLAMLMATISSGLVGGFNGAQYDGITDTLILDNASIYKNVLITYRQYQEEQQELFEQLKEDYLQETMKTIEDTEQVYVDGYEQEVEVLKTELVMEEAPYFMPDGRSFTILIPVIREYYETETQLVDGYWEEQTIERDVNTATVEIQQNPIDLACILAYLTVTQEDVLAQREYLFQDSLIIEYLNTISVIETEECTIPEEERQAAEGDDRYLEKNTMIYNNVFSFEEIAEHYFAEDPDTYEMFKTSYELYTNFLEHAVFNEEDE